MADLAVYHVGKALLSLCMDFGVACFYMNRAVCLPVADLT